MHSSAIEERRTSPMGKTMLLPTGGESPGSKRHEQKEEPKALDYK
jgi:hypothetical protein